MTKKEKQIALYVVENETSPQFRYRVYNVRQITEKSKKWQVNYVKRDDLSDHCLSGVNLMIIERQTGKDNKILEYIRKAKSLGIVVLFDLDDLTFDYRDLLILMRSIGSKNIIYWISYFWGIRRIAKRVDGFLVTNDYLGKKIKRSFNKQYKVIPNSLNTEQINISEKLAGKKKNGFTIGYFSGSPTHVKDFRIAEPALIKLMNKYEDVRLLIVGYMKLSSRMREMMRKNRIELLAPVDYLQLQSLIASVNVNIAPLPINDFANCKSELKFFESAIVKTITVASPIYSFRKNITNGVNGFLATQKQWYELLNKIYQNTAEMEIIADSAKKYALDNYYGDKMLSRVEKAYDYFSK